MFFLDGAVAATAEARRGAVKAAGAEKEVNKLRILLLINACFAFGSNFFFPFFSGDNFRP